ncbi:MAG: VWA domain-containing protein [Paludibacteraceae bacterium]|nr:VWA domain-containing protein [Paludibacteraceae bacterium]
MLFTKKKEQENAPQELIKDEKTHIFNLIILDESGSMHKIEEAARSGCNEVLGTIRKAAEDNAEIEQNVTLVFFDDTMRYIYKHEKIDNVKDIDREYCPRACTALYDAMGISLTALEKEVDKYDDAIGLVTVITDGQENSSREYSGKEVYDLVGRLREKGWTFAFMGANQDVMETAKRLNIKNTREFEYTNSGMRESFTVAAMASINYNTRIAKSREATKNMSKEEKMAYYSAMESDADFFEDQK